VTDLIVPAAIAARAGICPGDDVVYEADTDGVRLVNDTLRKVYVETTSHCNLDCPMCVRHGWHDVPGHMPMDRFERLVDGLLPLATPDAITLTFGGFGEPLVHPAWEEMVVGARTRKLRVEMITNGVLLDGRIADVLVQAGVAQVTVSIDGGDGASYQRMRGASADGALDAIRRLRDARRLSRRRMAVGVAAVATRSTVGSLPALLDWASDLKVDFVSIGNLVPHTEEMSREILWERSGWASVFRPSAWRPRITVGRFDMEDVTRPLAEALAARGLTFPSPLTDEGRWRNRCRFAHEGLCALSWDGRVAPCLSLLHSHTECVNHQVRRVDDYVVGRVDDVRLPDIWRKAAFREFRRRVRAFDFPPCFHCGGCHYTEGNVEDCYGNPAPVCGQCPWAQGLVLCP
jgi:MoaA/NifB/PqqE/SkfB family radical SAM enzyme